MFYHYVLAKMMAILFTLVRVDPARLTLFK